MADNNFIASIDIGSSKIAVFLADEENGRMRVFGHAIGRSSGVRKGVIHDIEQASKVIKSLVNKTFLSQGNRFHNVSVNISDPHLTVINREGPVSVSNGTVSQKDLDSAIQTASAITTPANKQIITNLVNRYTLDKDPITHQGIDIDQPLGQEAKTLEVSMHIVTASNQCIGAIEQSVSNSNLGIHNIVLNSMASSEACLSQEDKDNGVCLVDIGSGVINLSVFTRGGITYSSVIQEGGDRVTEAIMYAFGASFKEAERLKTAFGKAQSKLIREDALVRFQQADDVEGAQRYLSLQSLVEVIEQAYMELFELIKKDLKAQNMLQLIKSGFVLTGGATKIQGCDNLMLSHFKIRTKHAIIDTNKITADVKLLQPEFACALGLILYDDEPDLEVVEQSKNDNFFNKLKGHFNRKF